MALSKRPQKPTKDNTLVDMRKYFRSLDFRDLWEEWYTSLTSEGKYTFKTVKSFATKYSKNSKQQAFLRWLLGPVNDEFMFGATTEEIKDWQSFTNGPWDWKEKRDSGGWYSERVLEKVSQAITKNAEGLKALRNVGDHITIKLLARMNNLANNLDESIGPTLFVDNLKFHENVERTKAIFDLYKRLFELTGMAQEIFAKSHGINLSDLSGYAQIIASATAEGVSGAVSTEMIRTNKAIEQLTRLQLEAAAQNGIGLPPGSDRIVNVTPA